MHSRILTPVFWLTLLACGVVLGFGRSQIVAAKSDKVDICHIEGQGKINLINVSKAAVPAHVKNHGDFLAANFFADADGDGFGDPDTSSGPACAAPAGFVDNSGDCDDSDAAINPDAAEVYGDGVDNDCNPDTPGAPVCPTFSDSVEYLTQDPSTGAADFKNLASGNAYTC